MLGTMFTVGYRLIGFLYFFNILCMLFYNIKTFIIHYYIIEWLAYSSK